MDKDTLSAGTAPPPAAQAPPHRPLLPQAVRGPAALQRLVGVLFILVALAVTYTQWPHGLDHATYSLVSQLIPAQPDLSSVAFVDLGPAPADYATLAEAVTALGGRGVDRVGLYLPLHQSQSPPDMDALARDVQRGARGAPAPQWLARLDRDVRLADAIRDHGGVVLAAFPAPVEGARDTTLTRISAGFVPWHAAHPALEVLNRPAVSTTLTRDRLHPPLPQLGAAARSVGAALPPGFTQEVTLALDDPRGPWAGFLLPLLTPPRAMSTDVVLEPGRGLRVGDKLLPLGPALGAHPLPPRQDPRNAGLLVHDVETLLGGPAGASDLGGRIVILGHGDNRAPSVTLPSGLRLPEAIWQTYALGSLLDRAWVHVPGWFHGLERVLLLLAGLYLLSLPLHMTGRTAGLLLSLLIAVVVFNAGLLLLVVQQVWLPVTLPVVALLTGHGVLWAWLRHAEMLGQDRRDASEAHYHLGSLLRGQGQLEPAFTHFRQVRDVNEPLREQLYQLGHDMVRRRLYPRAVEVYAHLEAISPRYRDVPVRIERLRGLTGQGRGHFGNDGTRVESALIVDGDTLEKPTLGRYQVERQLGRGSMGIVYLGVDPKIGRKVAIKTLALNQEFDQEMLEQVKWRFFREAEASGRLNHRNIVTIYDVGEEHDLAFIAMDYLEGTSLDKFTRRDNLLPVGEVLEICAQVAEGLAYAHGQQVVHRDVKPANVIFDRRKGQVTITDFGIACLTDTNRTRTGTILGTPAFMSPEQVSGHPVDGRSDLFSLGVTLYQLLCGQLPFKADTMAGLVYQITQTRHQSISDICPELGPVVALILNRALEKDPERRYQSGGEFAKALRDCAAALRQSPKPGQFANRKAMMP